MRFLREARGSLVQPCRQGVLLALFPRSVLDSLSKHGQGPLIAFPESSSRARRRSLSFSLTSFPRPPPLFPAFARPWSHAHLKDFNYTKDSLGLEYVRHNPLCTDTRLGFHHPYIDGRCGLAGFFTPSVC